MTDTTRQKIDSPEQFRHVYDRSHAARVRYSAAPGLTESLVREISAQKGEPDWMLTKRLQALDLFLKAPMPAWGPSLEGLDLKDIVYFIRPDAEQAREWKDVPEEIRDTFEKLGIPEAEREALSGVGAQFDSDIVYHRLKEKWERKGVIFENMDQAVQKYPELVRKHFMTDCIPVNDHKFVMLHAAVWSGGTFIYVPAGVQVDIPMQAYFRMNAERGGQFEHTLIIAEEGSQVQYIEGCSAPRYEASSIHAGCVELHVKRNARITYSSIENWSKNTYNLNTKRAVVDEGGTIEWLNGNMGSGVTMLYPCSVLRGRGARSENIGVAFAGPGQHQDTGAKVVHAAPDTTSVVHAKSISRAGGISSYRGHVRMTKAAKNAKCASNCDALLLDGASVSNTYPSMRIDGDVGDLAHEATVGRIGEDEIFYFKSRGISEEDAVKLVVRGFIEPVVKRLPLEYAVELERLVALELERSVA